MTYTLRLAAIFCGEVQRVLDAASLLAGGKSIAKVGAGVKFIETVFVECLQGSEERRGEAFRLVKAADLIHPASVAGGNERV
jgi:hypothetical protein